MRCTARLTRRLAWLALLVDTDVVLAWGWSRTVGLPIAPASGGPEAIGTADVIAAIFELTLATLLVEVLRVIPRGRTAQVVWFAAAVGLLLQPASIALVVVGAKINLAALASSVSMG